MARPDLTDLIESAAPAPRAALDVDDIAWPAGRRRRRRHAITAGASVAAAALIVALGAQVLPDRHEPDVVVTGPASPRPIPLEFGPGTVTARLALLDGTEIALTLPEAVGAGFRAATVADLELHGSVHSDGGRGWRIDVSAGSVEEMLPGAEHLPLSPTTSASVAVVDQPGRRLGLQFGPWALVASGDSLNDADIETLVEGVALGETSEGFVEYRGSLPLWVVDSADFVVRGQGVAVSVFLSECTAHSPTSSTAAGLELARLEDAQRATSLTLLCARTQRIEVVIDAAEHLSDGDAGKVDVKVIRTGRTLSAVQGATGNAAPGRVPPGGTALDCGSSQLEYVDGVGDGGAEDLPSDPTTEEALQRYVENDPSLPDSGYEPLSQGDGEDGREEFVFTEDGRRAGQLDVQRSPDGGWRAVGHARCR